MQHVSRIRIVSSVLVTLVLVAAAALGVACEPLPHDGHAVTRGECMTCHEPEYQAAVEPLHVDVIPTTCGDCHDETTWSPASRFEHEGLPLHGKHAGVACNTCHTQGLDGKDPPDSCVGCHRDDYEAARMPSHTGFATDCKSCHRDTGWSPASFDHEWPLTGKHAMTACAGCHVGDPPKYEGTSKLCVDCHRDDYDGSAFPGHSAFATTCQDCHTTSGWLPASFDHPWPLEGKHAAVRCAGCHTGDPPKYVGTSKVCIDCHHDDYDGSPFPGHSSFATTCLDCHVMTGWTPATGGHPEARFPIKTGKHTRVTCTQCHDASLGPTGKDNANCIGCHEHGRAETDEHHKEERGYSYSNKSCLSAGCHPDGRKHD